VRPSSARRSTTAAIDDLGNGGELDGFAETDAGGGAGLAHAAMHIANERADLS
jgi:hypothetical protein